MALNGWTNHEEQKVRALFPSAAAEDVLAALPRHSWQAIRARASKLGVKRLLAARPSIANPLIAKLTAIRQQQKISQGSVAEMLGVDRATINKWERGTRSPPLQQFLEWIAALGCDLKLHAPDGTVTESGLSLRNKLS